MIPRFVLHRCRSRAPHSDPGIGGGVAAPPLGRQISGFLFAILACAGIDAQERKLPDAEIDRLLALHHTEREQVRLVQVPVVVTNRRGKLIRGLGPEDFRLSEDHVPQEIKYFTTENAEPISIAFLLDISGSMRQVGKLDEAKEAIRTFVEALGDRDRFGLVCFADDQVDWVTGFTTDRVNFLRRLAVQEAYGQTALIDAVAATPVLVDREVGANRAIVLFTDGIDTASEMGIFDALQRARSVNVPIYAVGFAHLATKMRLPGSRPRTERLVELFAEETGGALFPVYDPDDLKEAVRSIQDELRFRYVIGYHPSRRRWDGTFRRIRLEVVDRRLQTRARTGYYAEP